MLFSMKIGIKDQANITLFRQTIKILVTPRKRRCCLFRSALLCIFLLVQHLPASFEDQAASARIAGLADAGVALSFGADGIFINPASLFYPPNHFDVHLFYTKPFGLPELHLGNCAVRLNYNRLAGAIAVQHFGNAIYAENQFLLGAAYRVLPTVVVGATGRLGSLSIQSYGQTHSFLLDIGTVVRLSSKTHWGVAIKNATNAKIGVNREPLPTLLTSGICIKPHSNVLLLFDLSKDTRFPLDVRCGVDYTVYKPLHVRLGVGSEPTRYCAGFSITCARVRIDYAFSSHIDLGLTHVFSIGIF